MEEFVQHYICPTCESIKNIYAEGENKEHFTQSIPDKILCLVDNCQDYAVPVDNICLGSGHVHGYSYFKDTTTGIILCSRHKDMFNWVPLKVENVLEYTPDKPDPTRRENW